MQTPLYQRIVNDITGRIENAEFKTGDRMYSVDECCRYYNVSATTAVRALDELKQRQLIHSIKGKGSFFKGLSAATDSDAGTSTLDHVIIVSDAVNFFRSGFQLPICEGIQAEASKHGLEVRLRQIPALDASGRDQLPFPVESESGLIIIGGEISPMTVSLLRKQRTVLVDVVIPGLSCVATNNLAGMAQLIDHLTDLGHKRLLLAAHSSGRPNPTNDNERREAFDFIVRDRRVTGEIIPAVSVDAIIERCRQSDGPTAVMFTQDDPALEFIETARATGLRIPQDISVTGFDGVALDPHPSNGLTTLAVDREGMGCTAMQALLQHGKKSVPLSWHRVPGALVTGDSTAAVHTSRRRG